MSVTPVGLALVEESARSASSARRPGDTDRGGRAGRRPSYSAIRTKLGEVMVSVTPRPAPIALARCVLPAPRSPHRQIRSPATRDGAERAAECRRCAGSGQSHGGWRRSDRRRGDHPGVAEGRAKRSRSPSGTATTVPSSRRTEAPSSWTPPANRHGPTTPAQAPRDRRARRPARGRDPGPARGRSGRGSSMTSAGRIGRRSPPRARRAREDGHDRRGQGSPGRAVEHEHRERRQAMQRGALARLRGAEVPALLAGEARHDDPADAHGAGPGEGLGIDPRADDEDGPGQADVEAAGPQLAVPGRRHGQPSAGRPAEDDDAGHGPPLAWMTTAPPGRTSRTMPASGLSMVSDRSPLATRQRLRHSNSSSPRGTRSPGSGRAQAGTARSTSRGSRTRSMIGEPATTDSPTATSGRSPAARAKVTSVPAARPGGGGATRPRPGAVVDHRSRPGPQAPTASRQQVAPPVGPFGQAERDIAQVDEEAAEAARHVDREVPAAGSRGGPCRGTGTRPTAVAPGGRVDELEAARREVDVSSDRRRPWTPHAARPIDPRAGPAGMTTLPSGTSRSSARSASDGPAFVPIRDRAEGPEQASVVEGDTGWPLGDG